MDHRDRGQRRTGCRRRAGGSTGCITRSARRICLLDYPPGMRLSEEAMAREFGVSRTPLRRVLGRLETEGLVQSVHGVGTMVTDVDIDELAQVFALRLELAELAGTLDPAAADCGRDGRVRGARRAARRRWSPIPIRGPSAR